MSHERKNIIFNEKNFNPKNTFNNIFRNRIFSYYHFLSNFKKLLNFYESWLTFSRKIFSTSLPYIILKINNKILKRNYFFKKMFLFEKFF